MTSRARLVLVLCLNAAAAPASDCTRASTGLAPLDAPYFATYQGMAGGLYPGESNVRPAAHEAVGLQEAARIVPRNPAGEPDEQNGRIVLLSIGMSNTTQEFSVFKSMADQYPGKNPRLVVVDGAQGGWSADRFISGAAEYWKTTMDRLRAAGVTAAQVEAAWLKQADAGPKLSFPDDARTLQSHIRTIVLSLRSMFPNLRVLYLSSRIYAGYATTELNPEPYAYQGGFAVKWLIEQQIEGEPRLATDAVPWMAWGPYLWADGARPRFDGLTYACSDLRENDGTHPWDGARAKVARMLLDFFSSDSTARPWFVRAQPSPPTTPKVEALTNSAGFFETVAPGSIATLWGTDLAGETWVAGEPPLPAGAAGTSVWIGGQPAPLYFVSPGQINLLVPAVPRDQTVVVRRETTVSTPLTVPLQPERPGVFLVNGAAAAMHPDGALVSPAAPARRGEEITVLATGKGIRNPAIQAIPVFLPVVRVGGAPAQVSYWGAAPVWPGLDQLTFTIPSNAPTGDRLVLELQIGGFSANASSIAVR